MGGQSGGFANPAGQALVNMGTRLGGVAPAPQNTGASYTPLSANVYTPAFSSVQSNQAPTASPAQQVQHAGLQALMANMMAQYQNVPGALAMTQQRPQMQLPRFTAPALAYRPNIQAVQQNLSRVKPSVYKTDLDAARARIAELEGAQQASFGNDAGYSSGG